MQSAPISKRGRNFGNSTRATTINILYTHVCVWISGHLKWLRHVATCCNLLKRSTASCFTTASPPVRMTMMQTSSWTLPNGGAVFERASKYVDPKPVCTKIAGKWMLFPPRVVPQVLTYPHFATREFSSDFDRTTLFLREFSRIFWKWWLFRALIFRTTDFKCWKVTNTHSDIYFTYPWEIHKVHFCPRVSTDEILLIRCLWPPCFLARSHLPCLARMFTSNCGASHFPLVRPHHPVAINRSNPSSWWLDG